MKRVIITIALLLTLTAGQAQQQVTREGNTFSVVTNKTKQATETKTKYEWQDAKGNKHTIYVGKTGACYIKRISKAGNEYKQYLGAEVSAQVCRELGIEYKPKSNSK